MERTQIYLTANEKKALKEIACRLGKRQSEVIRIALDRLIEGCSGGNRLDSLRRGCGLWKDRADLPDFALLRKEFDRKGLAME